MAHGKLPKILDVGQKFGRLIVISPDDPFVRSNGVKLSRSRCLCVCGKYTIVQNSNLRSGTTKSCGCLKRDTASNKTHGRSKTRAHRIWCNMKDRCYREKNPAYKNYGARGIKVYDKWKNSFEKFIADVGEPPPGHSMERINNDLGYFPGNVRWATPAEQALNTRRNTFVEWQGNRMTLGEAIKKSGVSRAAVMHRLARGWSTNRALETPLKYTMVERNGERIKLSDVSREVGVPYYILYQRVIKGGWSLEDAISTPINKNFARNTK